MKSVKRRLKRGVREKKGNEGGRKMVKQREKRENRVVQDRG